MADMRCPICERAFDASESTSLPFCSRRCRQIDLGRWLGEEYGLPRESDDDSSDDEDGPPDS